MWLVALALLVKALIPAGYMPGQSETRLFDIIICSDPSGMRISQQLAISFDKDVGDHSGQKATQGDCAFTSLAHGSAPGADPILLVAAIAFVLMLGFVAVRVAPLNRIAHLRPPLRGPPAIA